MGEARRARAPGGGARGKESDLEHLEEIPRAIAQAWLPAVECTVGDLNQVFLNLFINAAHAIADVVKGTDTRGTIRVVTRTEGDAVVIAISDTGGGIPEAVRAKIFDPFFTTKEVGRGSGQGLAIARSIVAEKHGGTITFETEIGRGTTFFIRLPLAPGAPAAPDERGGSAVEQAAV